LRDCCSHSPWGAIRSASAIFRVTPQGIIQGREAIQKISEFHDLSATIAIVRPFGNSIWEAGEWSMMIGDRPVRGYFSATLVREADKYKIRDETFNVVPPASGQQPASK
jgi:hypothetical protein